MLLLQVSRRYNLSIHKLCADNNIDPDSANQDQLYAGRQLLVRTMENDFKPPKIVAKGGNGKDFVSGLVRRIRREVHEAVNKEERKQSLVVVGADEGAEKSLAERRKERVRLQLMERKAQRDILLADRARRAELALKGPGYESSTDEEDEGFTGEV